MFTSDGMYRYSAKVPVLSGSYSLAYAIMRRQLSSPMMAGAHDDREGTVRDSALYCTYLGAGWILSRNPPILT